MARRRSHVIEDMYDIFALVGQSLIRDRVFSFLYQQSNPR